MTVMKLFSSFVLLTSFFLYAGEIDSLFVRGRHLFYSSVEEPAQIETAIAVFQDIAKRQPALAGRAMTYIGSLKALQGKFAFWPHTKWKLANQGLAVMDSGLSMNPDDIESLFVHSSTCYFLPFFFKRGEQAQKHFKRMIELLPSHLHEYDPELMRNVVRFLLDNARLSTDEINQLNRCNEILTQSEH